MSCHYSSRHLCHLLPWFFFIASVWCQTGQALDYDHTELSAIDGGCGRIGDGQIAGDLSFKKRTCPRLEEQFVREEELHQRDLVPENAATPSAYVESPTYALDTSTITVSASPAPAGSRTGPPRDVELRILPVGDSITVGYRSSHSNGYRKQLYNDLHKDYKNITFAGTVSEGDKAYSWFAAWTGETIQAIEDRVGPALQQRPNIILIHAGTNDMSSNPSVSQQGNDPTAAAERLGSLIGKCVTVCPDATILVAQIIYTCLDDGQQQRTLVYNSLVPGVVDKYASSGHRVMVTNMQGGFPVTQLHSDDCIHPTNKGYKTLGNLWNRAIRAIPENWVKPPVGPDPAGHDGGPERKIPGGTLMLGWIAISYFILTRRQW